MCDGREREAMTEEEYPLMKQRRILHEAIQETLPVDERYLENVVSGWVLIVETAEPESGRRLTTFTSDASGESDLLPWSAEGWLRYVADRGDEFLEGIRFEPDENE